MSTQEPTDDEEHGGPMPASDAEEILSTPPAARALDGALANRPGRRGLPTSTGVLVAIVLVALGFFGGLLVGRHTASGQTISATGGFPQGFPTPGGGAGAGGTPGGFTAGTVTRVEGDTLYIETADGGTVKVVTTGDTRIQISRQGTLADLSKGSTVLVQGSANDQGVIEADRVSEGDLGFGGAQFPGATPTGSTSGG
jgi:hypothetical protein